MVSAKTSRADKKPVAQRDGVQLCWLAGLRRAARELQAPEVGEGAGKLDKKS